MNSTDVVIFVPMARLLPSLNAEQRRGWISTFLSKHEGVELLRNGVRLSQHAGRFSQTGSYATSLSLSDYIILDCSRPVVAHSSAYILSLNIVSLMEFHM